MTGQNVDMGYKLGPKYQLLILKFYQNHSDQCQEHCHHLFHRLLLHHAEIKRKRKPRRNTQSAPTSLAEADYYPHIALSLDQPSL